MPKQKAYFMRLNIGDLHSSPAWRVMKPIQRGAYIELFTLCFSAGGKLPNDPEQLRLMSGMTVKEWHKYGGLVLAQFEPHTDGDGTLTQSRVVKELTAISERGEKARASASARWTQPPDANAYRTQSEGNAIQKTEDRRQKTDIYPPTPQGGGADAPPVDQEGVPKKPVKKEKPVFIPPTIDEIEAEMKLRGFVSPRYWAEKFRAHYESKGWKVGREKMKDWRAAVRGTWDSNRYTPEPRPHGSSTHHNGTAQRGVGAAARTPEAMHSAFAEQLREIGAA